MSSKIAAPPATLDWLPPRVRLAYDGLKLDL